MSEIILNLPSEKATSEFGKKISENLKIGDIIYLSGEMGSGKTTLFINLLSQSKKKKISVCAIVNDKYLHLKYFYNLLNLKLYEF